MPKDKIVLKDIAKATGKAVGTVSLALRDDPVIKRETREYIQKIALKLNYHPSALGRALATQRTFIIGLTITDIMNPFYGPVIKSVEAAAGDQHYHVMLCNTGYEPDKEKNYIRVFIEGKVDGVVIDPVENNEDFSNYADLARAGIPFVLLRNLRGVKADYVMVDDERASFTLTKHMIGLGRKHIAYIGNTKCGVTDHDRFLGFKRAVSEAGQIVDPELIIATAYSIKDGYIAAKELLARGHKVDAIIAFGDMLALGALDALAEAKVSVPKDVSIGGFDDIEFARHARVPLTTMALPAEELGRIAVDILMKKIKGKKEGKRSKPESVILQAKLVVRDSCGAGYFCKA